jgi:hypothetical protein
LREEGPEAIRTRRTPSSSLKRNILTSSSNFYSSVPNFPHPSSPKSRTPYQLPTAGPIVIVFLSLLLPQPSNSFSLSSPPTGSSDGAGPGAAVVDLCSGYPRAGGGARARRSRPSTPTGRCAAVGALSLPNGGASEEQGPPAMPPPRSTAAGSCQLPPTVGAPSCYFPRRQEGHRVGPSPSPPLRRAARGSGAASSLLCGGNGGAREEQGQR